MVSPLVPPDTDCELTWLLGWFLEFFEEGFAFFDLFMEQISSFEAKFSVSLRRESVCPSTLLWYALFRRSAHIVDSRAHYSR